MSRFREIQTDISPTNLLDTPRRSGRRISVTSNADTQPQLLQSSINSHLNMNASEVDEEENHTLGSSASSSGSARIRTSGMPRAKAMLNRRQETMMPTSSSHVTPEPGYSQALALESDSSDDGSSEEDSIQSEEDEYVTVNDDDVEEDDDDLLDNYRADTSEIPFAFHMSQQLENMQITQQSAIALWNLGVHSLDKLFILREQELMDLCNFRMTDLLSFRLIKAVHDQSHSQNLPSGLVSIMPVFRGRSTEPRSISDPQGFLLRFEAILASSNIHPSRWANLLVLNLAKPEDSSFWRNHLERSNSPDWSYHKRMFLEHFECYDQRAKYVEAVYCLQQKLDESIQSYFDSAAEVIRRAHLTIDDPLVIGCLRKGIRESKIQEFITMREEPRRAFTFHELMSLSLLAEDRFKIVTMQTPKKQTEQLVCVRCHAKGHIAANCSKRDRRYNPNKPGGAKNDEPKRQKRTCRQCPGENHSFSTCPKNTCVTCKQPGHLAFACPKAVCSACNARGHTPASFSCPKHPNKGKNKYLHREEEQDDKVSSEVKSAIRWKQVLPLLGASYDQVMVHALELTHESVKDNSIVTIPVILNNYRCVAMIDTGASHSIIDVELAKTLLISDDEMEPVSSAAQAVFTGLPAIPVKRTPTIQMAAGRFNVVHQFLVAQVFTPLIIGRDLLHSIGISISGLPVAFPDDIERNLNPTAPSTSTDGGNDETHEVFHALPRIPSDEMEQLTKALEESLNLNEQIPESNFCNHAEAIVKLEMDDYSPIYRPQFEIPERLHSVIDEQVAKWLTLEKIEHASPANRWNASLLVVPKQDLYGNKSDWRVCFDARSINSRLKPDTYGIPRIKELFKRISGFNYCSSLDLVSAYQQLPVEEEYRDILTFTWKGQKYRFSGSPFGLTHLPGQFQRLMNCALAEHYQYVLVYLDDVFIFSKTLEEHIVHCNKVIQTLTTYNLRLRRGKCHFGYREAVLLGHIISGDQIRADPRKVATFAGMKRPTTGKQLQALLGFASYLRDYIPKYSTIAAPLEAIKNTKVLITVWSEVHENAFVLLKNVLSSSAVLSTPKFDKPFLVATDSSQYGNGAVLYQEIDGKVRYVQFFAKALNKSQINYPATKRELLAIVQALKQFRYYLHGRHFDLFTDHKALTFLFTSKDPSYMMLNWMEELLSFDFEIHHRPGIEMILPDALSRLFAEARTLKGGNESVQNELTDCVQIAAVEASNATLTKRCKTCMKRTAQSCNTGFCKFHCTGCRIHPSVQNNSEQKLDQPLNIDTDEPSRVTSWMREFISNVLEKKEPDEEQKEDLIQKEHEVGHASAEQMFKSLFRKGWYWQTMKQQCSFVSNSCENCLQFNIARQGYHPLVTITASLPFDHVAIDLGQISQTSQQGNNFFLVVTDVCTRFSLLRALPNKAALTVGRQLYQIITEFGLPRIIQSDNGSEFVNSVVDAMKEHCGFSQRTISSYHPQANGTAESHVKIVKQLLNKYVKGDWSEWCIFIPAIQLAMNTRITKRHSSTPFSLMFARPLNHPNNYQDTRSELLTEEQMIERNRQLTRILYPAVTQASDAYNQRMIDGFQISHRILKDGYPKGAYVMRRVDMRTSKSEPRYEGPFKVLERTQNNTYVLLDAAGALYQKRVPVDQLKLISVPDVHLNLEEQYEVESVLDHKGNPSKREYLVKWKNYPSTDNSWVKASDFSAPQVIHNYWSQKKRKNPPRHP